MERARIEEIAPSVVRIIQGPRRQIIPRWLMERAQIQALRQGNSMIICFEMMDGGGVGDWTMYDINDRHGLASSQFQQSRVEVDGAGPVHVLD